LTQNIGLHRLPATAVSHTLVGLEWSRVSMKTILRRSIGGKATVAGLLVLMCAQADAQAPATPAAEVAAPATAYVPAAPLSADQLALLRQAIDAAQAGDTVRAASIRGSISDPLARRLVLWAMIDAAGSNLSFYELDPARTEMLGWPRAARRQAVTEKAMETAGLPPQRVIDWFGNQDPQTPEGAMALAAALQLAGRQADATTLIRRTWRERVFEAEPQVQMLTRFGALLTPDDHAARLDLLLYGPQGPAARALLPLVTPEVRALGEARIALRANRDDAAQLAALVPASLQGDKSLAYERARYFRRRGLDGIAATYAKNFPAPPASYGEAARDMWTERRLLMNALIRNGDFAGAYAAVTNHGLPPGTDYTEAEFFAGWLALNKLNEPAKAGAHFANIEKVGVTPITVSRALYWQGRAAEAMGDKAAAHAHWTKGAKYFTAFYGQLSAERAGVTRISLPPEPNPTAADRARFEGRDLVRAARMLGDAGERDLFRTFVLAGQESLSTGEELALMVDMARLYGDQDLAMRVVRAGAQRQIQLPERGYPLRSVPQGYGLPESALVHAVIRQESGFDPGVRSGAGARGMMQLMPATAQVVARKVGVGYSADRLGDADYNMRLGATYLGGLVDDFSGSYVMAAAGYNAGPSRSRQWAATCGDPRGGADPSDFVECIPFAETRNYVMRVMENVQVYRARLGGGMAPLTLAADLKRGGWTPSPSTIALQGAAGGGSATSCAAAATLPTMTTWQPPSPALAKTENC
jgi:soluble lytic murein transglycosylase